MTSDLERFLVTGAIIILALLLLLYTVQKEKDR